MRPSVFVVCLLDAFTPDLHLLLRGERQIKLIIRWVCRMYRMFRFLQKSNFLCHMRAQNDEEMFPHVLWFCCFSLGSFSDVDVNDSEVFFIYIFLTDAERQSWTVSPKSLRWNVRENTEKITCKHISIIIIIVCHLQSSCSCQIMSKKVAILFHCVYFGL